MNERIKDLANQAEDYADSVVDQGGEFHPAYTEKFAELIIKECVDQTWLPGTYHDTALRELNEHFGIKQ